MGLDPQHILDKKHLSKSEQIAVEHYKKKPDGRGFFAVAEIMAKHQQWDEAIQLLSFGLERHPSYSVARVFLSHLLFRRHNFVEAWGCLDKSPTSLKANLTAQLLRLKLSILLGKSTEARELVKELSQQDFQESETLVIIEQMDIKPFSQVRRDYADFLKIPFHVLPQDKPLESDHSAYKSVDNFLKAANRDEEEAQASFRERVAKGFFASSIQGLFSKPITVHGPDQSDLDELTRARLLRRQGLYLKASEIYQRLVHESPGNELIRREYNEICDLRETQKEIDKRMSPEIVESMEKVRKIDSRLRLLNDLLNRLDEVQDEAYF
jgi:tetratricopeptide (TPR) repeat protein